MYLSFSVMNPCALVTTLYYVFFVYMAGYLFRSSLPFLLIVGVTITHQLFLPQQSSKAMKKEKNFVVIIQKVLLTLNTRITEIMRNDPGNCNEVIS